jgi:4-hydroxythreonine-4-phosphate dehydrogenase
VSAPRLGVTVGDPAGIGPEIVARAIASGELGGRGPVVVYAEPSVFGAACRAVGVSIPSPEPTGSGAGVSLRPVDAGPVPADFAPGRPGAFTGAAAAACIEAAARDALAGRIDAVVTAPIAKSALRAAGIPHPGHTEMLAEIAGVPRVAMMFAGRGLHVTLATIHVALRDVPRVLTVDGIVETVRLTRECLVGRAGIAAPRLAVLGLNPHAGEGGLFGDEEARILAPALDMVRARGWRVEGPFPADSFFARHAGEHDGVIAMYHDQGLIPIKLLSGGRAVNVTLGLPFLRTSVDHGTAFDIAGRGVASEDSLVEAARLAERWAVPGEPPPGS